MEISIDAEARTRKRRKQKKAPQAPKKALTPYIFFSQEVRPQIKESVPPGTKVTEIVRIIAEKWSNLSPEEKAPYIKMAEDDKVRYNQEISTYDGPLHVPVNKKRGHQNKVPGAPKRAMSPFLFFSNEKRAQIQTEYPNMKITEVSAKLGEIWRDMTDEEKAPYVEKSKSDRDRYKSQQSEFKGKNPQPLPTKTNNPVAVPLPVSSQWNMPMPDNTSSTIYSHVYDMSMHNSSFTNISIPTGFSNM